MIIRNQKASDFIVNIFYLIRFWVYRHFRKGKLKYRSQLVKHGWSLSFLDDFTSLSMANTGDPIKGRKWLVGDGWAMHHPDNRSQHYVPPTHDGSDAVFHVKHNPKVFTWNNKTYTIPFEVSYLNSSISFSQMYGRFECRCTIPYDKYVWPAFWMYGKLWPPEIDIFELYGNKNPNDAGIQKINLHYGRVEENNKEDMRAWGVRVDTKKNKDRFHEFAVEWYPDKIIFITDGITVFRYTRKDILDKWFNMPMWIIVNHAIQGKEYLDEIPESYTSSFKVDYVRAYMKI